MHEFFLTLALWFFSPSCCGGVSEQLGGCLAASWGQTTTLLLSLMRILGLYQSCLWLLRGHRRLNFVAVKQSCEAPAPGTGKAGGTRGTEEAWEVQLALPFLSRHVQKGRHSNSCCCWKGVHPSCLPILLQE